MGRLETRTEETQTPIPTTPRFPRTILSSDKNITQELTDIVPLPTTTTSNTPHFKRRISNKHDHLPGALHKMCRRQGYMIQNIERKCVTTKQFWKTHKQVNQVLHQEVSQLAEQATEELIENNLKTCIIAMIIEDRNASRSEMKRSLQDQANDLALWEALKRKFKKSSTANTSCRDDNNHSHHDDHQKDDAPPEGEKRQQQQQQEWDAWVEEIVIDEDEVVSEDETPKLITELLDVDKRVPTIYDYERMKATLSDAQEDIRRLVPRPLVFFEPQWNPNEPLRYLYNKDMFFLKYGNTKEKKYILSLHKIHAERFPEAGLEEKMNSWVRKEFKTFNEEARLTIKYWKDSWHKRVCKQNQRKVRDNPKDYFLKHKIIEVVRIITDQPHGLDFMEQIIVMRENDKP
nr:hypothetical protein [Tanacetum cinerariifolium]